MRKQSLALAILLLLTAGVTAQTMVGEGLGEQDYLLLPEVARAELPVPKELDGPCFDCGQDLVQYYSFQNIKYQLRRYYGKHVVLLLPDDWGHDKGLSPEERRTLLDDADLIYDYYLQILGGEPNGEGHLKIAFIDVEDPWFSAQAWRGLKGIELDSNPLVLKQIRDAHADRSLAQLLMHQMAKNFDIYADKLEYIGTWNQVPIWTDFLVPFAYYYTRTPCLGLTADEQLRISILHGFLPYAWDSSATWERCVKYRACRSMESEEIWAGFSHLIALLHGPEAVTRSLAFLATYEPFSADDSAEDREDAHIESLAHGAQVNLSCYADILRWQASEELRERMSAAYGDEAPFCENSDSDGYTAIEGDCNDDTREVRPRERETLDGVDQDCNGVVDDIDLNEIPLGDFDSPLPITAPVRIRGRFSSGDIEDTFEIEVKAGTTLRCHLCTEDSNYNRYWYSLVLSSDGEIRRHSERWEGNGCSIVTYHFPQPGTWLVKVDRYLSWKAARPYTLLVHEVEPVPRPAWGRVEVESQGQGSYLLTAVTEQQSVTAAPPDQLRFWASGFGFIATLPWQPVVSYDWQPGIELADGVYSIRAQLFQGNIPFSGMSERAYLGTPATDFSWWFEGPLTGRGQTVRFEDRSQRSPQAWTWSIESSTRSGASDTIHTFHASGQYQVELSAANSFGESSRIRTVTIPGASPTKLRLTASIYGTSRLFVRGNIAWWQQLGGPAPGSKNLEPTIINDRPWNPQWPQTAAYDASTCYCSSDVFDMVEPPLAMLDATSVEVNEMTEGEHVVLVQSPSAANDYTLILELTPPSEDGGTVDIETTLTWQQLRQEPRRGRRTATD
jgi:hypothetical protein